LNDFVLNATNTFSDIGVTLSLLGNETATIADGLNSTKEAISATLSVAQSTSYMLNVFQKQVGQNFTFIQGEIGNITNAIGDIRDALHEMELTDGENFKRLMYDITNVTNQMNTHFSALTDVINRDRQKAAADKISL